ncbi:MAG: hypothetical protein AB7Q29_15855 [Vicinamibacterales bacterium]
MHTLSTADREFMAAFEACEIPRAEFRHRAHLRLAYCYLAGSDAETAIARCRSAIVRFIRHNGIDPAKYSETLTQAWVLAVHHFMQASGPANSADEFLERSARLLDSRIMSAHYSADVLSSPEARSRFVEPDRLPIPRYARNGEVLAVGDHPASPPLG